MSVKIYSYYNNKGGVGKTTICQNVAAAYAELHPEKQVLVIDMCPQANISQFLLGGGHLGFRTNQKLQSLATRRNVVGFVDWILKGNAGFASTGTSYSTQVSQHNAEITDNLYLIAGDNFLESLSLALNYAVINPANTQAWAEFMTSIRRLCATEQRDDYEDLVVFIDCNPSFSIYTQMALLSSDYLVVPFMADFTSLEGIKGLFSMLFGLYSSPALKKYASNVLTFSKNVANHSLQTPAVWEFVFNNFTVNMGVATAFGSIKNEIVDFCYKQYTSHPQCFASAGNSVADAAEWANVYMSDVKDFHTAGTVSSSLGIPIHRLPNSQSYSMPDGTRIVLPLKNYSAAVKQMSSLVGKIH